MLSDDLLKRIPTATWHRAGTPSGHHERQLILSTAVAAAYRDLANAITPPLTNVTCDAEEYLSTLLDREPCPAIGDGNRRCAYLVGHPGAHAYDFPRPMGVVHAEAQRETETIRVSLKGYTTHPLDHAALPDPADA